MNTFPHMAIKASNGSVAFKISDPCFHVLWKTQLKSFRCCSFFLTGKYIVIQQALNILPSSSISIPLLSNKDADLLIKSWSFPSNLCQFAMTTVGVQLNMHWLSRMQTKFDKKGVKLDIRYMALRAWKYVKGYICSVISQLPHSKIYYFWKQIITETKNVDV